MFAYAHAHCYRPASHYEALPVNALKCPVYHCHADVSICFLESATNSEDSYYEPNSFGGASQAEGFRERPLKISGDPNRYKHREGNGDFAQPQALFQSPGAAQQKRLGHNVAASTSDVPALIIQRQLALFGQVDKAYGKVVRERLREVGVAFENSEAA